MGHRKDRVLASTEVAAELGISERTLERWIKRGKFPEPVRFGVRRQWLRSAVDAWVAAIQKGGSR